MLDLDLHDLPHDRRGIRISLAAPETIRLLSHGEVTVPATLDKGDEPEPGGLLCPRVFGKRDDFAGRRTRFGHIELAAPVVHPWFLKTVQAVLGLSPDQMRAISRGRVHVLVDADGTARVPGSLLTLEARYDLERRSEDGEPPVVETGAEGLYRLLRSLDPVAEHAALRAELEVSGPRQRSSESVAGRVRALRPFLRSLRAALTVLARPEVRAEVLRGRPEIATVLEPSLAAVRPLEPFPMEDLRELVARLHRDLATLARLPRAARGGEAPPAITERLSLLRTFLAAVNLPEWMVLRALPVLPAGLRPVTVLDPDHVTDGDLNDLYAQVIRCNDRLRDESLPSVTRYELGERLQKAVESLFDTGMLFDAEPFSRGRRRPKPRRSLVQRLSKKQGRFRNDLLGKRVDYSGRSVIVPGPRLGLRQCGLPYAVAVELFKTHILGSLHERVVPTPGVMEELRRRGYRRHPEVLREVMAGRVVLLNRHPTLHRPGIQAFEPVLVDGEAIRLHPLACKAFNADFDGDTMGVHLPIQAKAQQEATALLISTRHGLSPGDGQVLLAPTLDMVLGCFYATLDRQAAAGTTTGDDESDWPTVFANPDEVRAAHDAGQIGQHARVRVRIGEERICTTVGRVLLWDAVARDEHGRVVVPFEHIDPPAGAGDPGLTGRSLAGLLHACRQTWDETTAVSLAERLCRAGFELATRSGLSISLADLEQPPSKPQRLRETRAAVARVEQECREGRASDATRRQRVTEEWSSLVEELAEEQMARLRPGPTGPVNPLYVMVASGARGSRREVRQLGSMRGHVMRPTGELIETPLTSSLRDGLGPVEYFVSTHGARKGLTDKGIKTARTGYLTRRLVAVADQCVVSDPDCSALQGHRVEALRVDGGRDVSLGERVLGRVTLEPVVHPETGATICGAGLEIDEDLARQIDEARVASVSIRSVLTCDAASGVCARCYGWDRSRGGPVEVGEPVGIVAAQSMGEQATQLTLRTFHTGGMAEVRRQRRTLRARRPGIIRLEGVELLERDTVDGNRERIVRNWYGRVLVGDAEGGREVHEGLPAGSKLLVDTGSEVAAGQDLAEWAMAGLPILAEVSGRVSLVDLDVRTLQPQRHGDASDAELVVVPPPPKTGLAPRVVVAPAGEGERVPHPLPDGARLLVADGETVRAGDVIAEVPRHEHLAGDITQGLPRVEALLEATRKPRGKRAVLAEIGGEVAYERRAGRVRRILVRSERGRDRCHDLPARSYLMAREGDRVRVGDPLTAGEANVHDLVRLLGSRAMERYLVDEIQRTYRRGGAVVDDKHVEVVVREITRWGQVEDPGDTEYLQGELDVRERLDVPRWEPALVGLRQVAKRAGSFLRAASFEEPARPLREAALEARTDPLAGVRECVMVGRRAPLGAAAKGADDS